MYLSLYSQSSQSSQGCQGRLVRRDYPQLDPLAERVTEIYAEMAARGHALQLSPQVLEHVLLLCHAHDGNERVARIPEGWLKGSEWLPAAWKIGVARWLQVCRPRREAVASILVCGALPILLPESQVPSLSDEQESLLLWLYPSAYRPISRRDWLLLWAHYPDLRGQLKHCPSS